MSMQIGFVVPSNDIGSDPDDIAGWARRVEELGFSYLDVFDHVLGADTTDRPDWPGPYGIDHEFHEPFVLYGFLAAQTRPGLATGVLVLPQRQPAPVAKQAPPLAPLSARPLPLRGGIGRNPREHAASAA